MTVMSYGAVSLNREMTQSSQPDQHVSSRLVLGETVPVASLLTPKRQEESFALHSPPPPLFPKRSHDTDADGDLVTNSTIRTVIGRGHSWSLSSEDVRVNHRKQSDV